MRHGYARWARREATRLRASRLPRGLVVALLALSALGLANASSLHADTARVAMGMVLVGGLAAELARLARSDVWRCCAAAVWVTLTEAACVVLLLSGGWMMGTLATIASAVIANGRAFADEASPKRPVTVFHTTIAYALAGAFFARSGLAWGILATTFLPVVGAIQIMTAYARVGRSSRRSQQQLELATFLKRHSVLEDTAGRLGVVERELREGVVRCLDRVQRISRAIDAGQSTSSSVAAALEDLRAELRRTRTGALPVDKGVREVVEVGAPLSPVQAWFRRSQRYLLDVHFRDRAPSKGQSGQASAPDREYILTDLLPGVVAWLGMIAVGSYIPGSARIIQLDPWMTLGFGVLGAPFMVVLRWFAAKRGPWVFAVCWVTPLAMMEIACACLITRSSPAGSVAYVAQYALAIGGHAYHFPLRLKTPYILAPIGIGAVVGLAVSRGVEQSTVLLTTLAVSIAIGVWLSGVAERIEGDRDDRALVRSRWSADVEAETAARIERIDSALQALLSNAHDATSPLLISRLLVEDSECGAVPPRVLDQLTRIEHSFEQALATPAKLEETETIEIDVASVVAEVVARIEDASAVPIEISPFALRAKFLKGVTSAAQAFENLSLNAAEAARTRVVVRAIQSAEAWAIEVHDDGPGFPEGFRIAAFQSTRPEGLGLGLYTVERMVKLSGAALEIGVSDLGGACVAVVFAAASCHQPGQNRPMTAAPAVVPSIIGTT